MVYDIKQARPAPDNLKGPIHWLRENLFATPLDILQTFLVIAFLFWVVPPFLDWAILMLHLMEL